jgi:hypothetical protein
MSSRVSGNSAIFCLQYKSSFVMQKRWILKLINDVEYNDVYVDRVLVIETAYYKIETLSKNEKM